MCAISDYVVLPYKQLPLTTINSTKYGYHYIRFLPISGYPKNGFWFWFFDSPSENSDLEAELTKLLQEDDNDDDYLSQKLDGLRVHDSALGSEKGKEIKSSQKKDKIAAWTK